jgi:hypothetical protein
MHRKCDFFEAQLRRGNVSAFLRFPRSQTIPFPAQAATDDEPVHIYIIADHKSLLIYERAKIGEKCEIFKKDQRTDKAIGENSQYKGEMGRETE